MVNTTNQKETLQSLKGKILSLYKYLLDQQDLEHAEKVKQLAKKLENREFMIAFCGHFSAGKSTMINRVVGENLLPSSPIPTSANLVKVKSGEEYAKVFFKHEKPRLYLAPYDYKLVKNYCKDGDQIAEIEISHQDSKLPPNTVIMDTPGIDSADDAHRVATESALHLADLVFYVMDYNHVQAELNFLFTRELAEAGKEVYLVVNQIDKHKEEELSFQDFQKSVKESFASWGVKPAQIFYTSLKEPDYRGNQFDELQNFISQKLVSHEQLLIPAVSQSLEKIALDHLNQFKKTEEDKLLPVYTLLEEITDEDKKNLTDLYQEINTTLQKINSSDAEIEKDFDYQVAEIMKNAYLMPFQTRELAESYLESCQSEFKVGFLFSKQKTQEEKLARLGSFYKDILDKTKTQLEWHIKEFLLRSIKEHSLNQIELQSLAQKYKIDFSKDVLINAVKPGARVTGEYVLNYTEDVANQIKRLARNELSEFKSAYLEAIVEHHTQIKAKLEKEYEQTKRYMDAIGNLTDFEKRMEATENNVRDLMLNNEARFEEDSSHLFRQEEEDYEIVRSNLTDQKEQQDKKPEKTQAQVKHKRQVQTDISNAEVTGNEHLSRVVSGLQHTSSLISKLPGFQKLSIELNEKADRLKNKGFTVALFGAFSAGKSSFANALIGEKVLPVSPNPTTAAINRIKPITKENPHGTVLVKFKEKQAMLEDVNRSLKMFNLQADNFNEAFKMINQIRETEAKDDFLQKTHLSFLQAFNRGFDSLVHLLGTVLETSLKEFSDFVALEEKSCYVEWIELYYDCELTQKGITLVDTPGADSINARHTGVAFDYIKNSDAILFVTYYNHAFSKADREFLIQLGRVKESFQMDKMFFIINAIDLAENDEEKETVEDYVEEQLIKYGIRNPHLYCLSSLLALKEKLNQGQVKESGMNTFEQAFYHFISNDLTEMAISSAENELHRVYGLVEKLLTTSKEDSTVKNQKRLSLEEQKQSIQSFLQKQSPQDLQLRLTQEAEELVYYIKQRVFLRFNDFFKEAFNPSLLRDDGRNLKKALQSALDEFLESLGFDFAQEMRATTVRLDRFIKKLVADYQTLLITRLTDINADLSFSDFEVNLNDEIDFSSAFVTMNRQQFSKAMSYFKNPKSFFEKNEKKWMSEELEQVLNTPADDYLKEEANRLIGHYTIEVNREFERLISEMNVQAEDFYLSILSALDGGLSVESLEEVYEKLKQFQ